MKPHRGTLILVLGIVGMLPLCLPLGIVAWVMGAGDLKQMDAGTMDPAGRGTTQAGKICGIIGTVIMVIQIFWLSFGVVHIFTHGLGLSPA